MSDPLIVGHCPACGQATLEMDYASARLNCYGDGCSRRSAAHEILADRETEHRVTFEAGHGFTIRHPLRERLDDALMSCQLHAWLTTHLPEEADRPGLYRVTDYQGQWIFVALRTETKD